MRRGIQRSSPASPTPGDEAQYWLGFASAFVMIWHLVVIVVSLMVGIWDMLGLQPVGWQDHFGSWEVPDVQWSKAD